jgi:hypothetical protein
MNKENTNECSRLIEWIILVYDQKLTHSFTNEWHKKLMHSPKCSAPYKLAERDQKLAGQIAEQIASRTE